MHFFVFTNFIKRFLLSKIKDISNANLLEKGLKDENARIRELSARLLYIQGTSAQVSDLKELLQDPVPAVRFEAAITLSKFGDKTTIPVLIEALNFEDPRSKQGRFNTSWTYLINESLSYLTTYRVVERKGSQLVRMKKDSD